MTFPLFSPGFKACPQVGPLFSPGFRNAPSGIWDGAFPKALYLEGTLRGSAVKLPGNTSVRCTDRNLGSRLLIMKIMKGFQTVSKKGAWKKSLKKQKTTSTVNLIVKQRLLNKRAISSSKSLYLCELFIFNLQLVGTSSGTNSPYLANHPNYPPWN